MRAIRGTMCCAASASVSRHRRTLLAAGLIIERERGGDAAGSGSDALLRPLPRPPDVSDPGYARPRARLWRSGAGGGEPKYLNSPETALFHKGKELYGLYETRLARRPLKRLLLVEGYMDVVRLHQAGVHRCGRDARYGDHRRTPAPRVSPGERGGVLFRWRSRRTRGRLARAAAGVAGSARRPRDCDSCSCPRARIRIRWSGARAGSASRHAWTGAAAVGIPGGAAG